MKSKDIADLVKKDIDARKKLGIKKYGVPLRANNGRNAIQDLYEELLDASHYAKQRLVEEERAEKLWKDDATIELEYQLALEVTKATLAHYLKKKGYTKKKRIEEKLNIVADFPVWLDKEITKLQ